MTALERAEAELYGRGSAISLTPTLRGYRVEVWDARGALLWSVDVDSKRRAEAVAELRREIARRAAQS